MGEDVARVDPTGTRTVRAVAPVGNVVLLVGDAAAAAT